MAKPILILYGSVTGNAEYCAEKIAREARARGYDPTLENMVATEPDVLTAFDTVLLITSTFGDGEPPSGTEDFHHGIVKKPTLRFPGLYFSVLALGDTYYEQFCQCGKEYDAALEKLGGNRIYPRLDCDTDFEEGCEAWMDGVFAVLAEERLMAA